MGILFRSLLNWSSNRRLNISPDENQLVVKVENYFSALALSAFCSSVLLMFDWTRVQHGPYFYTKKTPFFKV